MDRLVVIMEKDVMQQSKIQHTMVPVASSSTHPKGGCNMFTRVSLSRSAMVPREHGKVVLGKTSVLRCISESFGKIGSRSLGFRSRTEKCFFITKATGGQSAEVFLTISKSRSKLT